MKVLRYESKKFFTNKFLVIFFLLLLVFDVGLTIYNSADKNKENEYFDKKQFEEAFTLYLTDKEAFMREFQAITGLENDLIEKRDYGSEEYRALTKRSNVFRSVLYHKDYIDKFEKSIEVFIKTAERNKADYISVGISPDSYLYRYQDSIIEVYTKVKNVKIEFEAIKGWDDYFQFAIPNILIIVFLLIAVPCIMLSEDNTGLKQIIHTTKYGRVRLYTAKYLFCIIITAVVSVLFLGLPLIAIYFTTGFSSAGNSIQAIEYFFVNPLPITIERFLFVSTGIKVLVFISISAVVMLFSILFRRVAYSFLASLAFCGLLYYLSTISYMNINNPVRVLNPFFITAADKSFSRYLGVNVFGYCFSHYSFIPVLYLLFMVAAGIAGGFLFVKYIRKGVMASRFRIPLIVPERLKDGIRGLQKRITVRSLYGYEFFKLLLAHKTVFVILLFIVVKALLADSVYGGSRSYEDEIYKDYMTKLEGEMTDEKRQYILDERRALDEILGNKSTIDAQYWNGSISYDKYSKFYTKYSIAEEKSKVFERVESHAAYIDRMADEGKTANFVYDTGWKAAFLSEFDFVLFLLFLFIFCDVFADEYRSGFDRLLKSTKKGRGKTFKAKFLTGGITAFVLTLAFTALDIIYLLKYNMFPAQSAPLVSIEEFGAAASGISLINYMVIMFVVRIVGFILLYALITALSELLRSSITVLGTVTTAAIIPYMLVKFGLSDAGYISLPAILSGTDYFLLSAEARLVGDFGLLILFLLVLTAVGAVLIRRSYKRYCMV